MRDTSPKCCPVSPARPEQRAWGYPKTPSLESCLKVVGDASHCRCIRNTTKEFEPAPWADVKREGHPADCGRLVSEAREHRSREAHSGRRVDAFVGPVHLREAPFTRTCNRSAVKASIWRGAHCFHAYCPRHVNSHGLILQ